MIREIGILMLGLISICSGQDRFESGDLEGFTKSPTEHIIVHIQQPFTVYAVEGRVLFQDAHHPLRGVVFEIRGPGISKSVLCAKSDEDGRFKITSVPEGTYTFKATKNGFQSVVGTVIVSQDAERDNVIKIEMPIGV